MPGTDKFLSAGFERAAQMGAKVGRGSGDAIDSVDEGFSSKEVHRGGALSGDVVDIDDGMFHHAFALPAPVSTGRPAPNHSPYGRDVADDRNRVVAVGESGLS